MTTDLTLKIGGEAGQGIQTIGTLLGEVCHGAGLFTFSVDDFESRIRGGHNFNLLRISDAPLTAMGNRIDILVAIDQKTLALNRENLSDTAVCILNSSAREESTPSTLHLPVAALAKEAGNVITANTVAAGAALAIMGAPFSLLKAVLMERFSAKGDRIVDLNVTAAQMGYDAAQGIRLTKTLDWNGKKGDRTLMTGAKAAALGAIASDCRFFSFYPMSPATGIISNVVPFSKTLPLVVEQAEDEIAAVTMALGASFAGARSLTTTSGGGFCLMTEALGHAAISETPLVIINAQRPGPATGMATRTAQADLLFAIQASQDDFPRFVFAPSTPGATFELTKKAFTLGEKYQVPVILLMDQYLTTTRTTQEPFPDLAEPGTFIITQDDMDAPETYKRYQFTESGVSPRALPCMGNALVRVLGNEHDEAGHITEDPEIRVRMMDKRNAKLAAMKAEMQRPVLAHPESKTLLVCWGSPGGVVQEAGERLRDQGFDLGWMVFEELWPMDGEQIKTMIENKTLILVEQNSTAQLGKLIAQETGIKSTLSILKYDGRPFFPDYIMDKAKEIIA
ncbi:MAG: 2-oxoacid:acceptor oxidoreductase subunit alpha [Desulfobacterium sp.]|nr:2-oxoacid:acceptor oxidoreductase subunit alpha [Desulfobacterium sp.]